MIYNVTTEESRRDVLIDHLRQKGFKRVIDIGGAMFPWAREVVTHYFDIIDPHEYITCEMNDDYLKKAKYIKGDINDSFGWADMMQEVADNGRFDFAICSQTLEDIRNPSYVIRMLPSIANEGFISVPHKWRELSYVEGHAPDTQQEWGLNKPYIGYCHHRWIFSVIEKEGVSVVRLFPKLEFISCVVGFQELMKDKVMGNELNFFWKDSIPFEIINDDFLGPNPPTVFQMYVDKLSEGV